MYCVRRFGSACCVVVFFLILFFGQEVGAREQDASLGMGLAGLADWSTELPFINHFKNARNWMTATRNDPSWDSQAYDQLTLDENGYPNFISDELEYVHTLLLRGIEGTFKTGKYIVAYRGRGTMRYGFNASLVPEESGENCPYLGDVEACDVIQVTDGSGGIHVMIESTDPADHIRDIAVVHEDHWPLYLQGEIFNPDWLAAIGDFRAIRFMDWMETNNRQLRYWRDRPRPEYATWCGIVQDGRIILHAGVPVEVMVALANKLHAEPWFNMPFYATDNYIGRFARYVRDNLDPDLKIHVEFSNEVWNWQFQQAQDANYLGRQRWGDVGTAYLNWYGMRNARMCDIWKDEQFGVFHGDDADRVDCLMSGQTANTYTFEQITTCPLWTAEGQQQCVDHNIDGLAITSYFNGGLGLEQYQGQVLAWIDDGSINEYDMGFRQLQDGSPLGTGQGAVEELQDTFSWYTDFAGRLGLGLTIYEGGQHITANGNSGESIQRLTDYLVNLNRDARMYDFYIGMLDAWYDPQQAVRTRFMHFTDVGPYSRYGSWGSMEYLGQTSAPKYRALVDWNRNHPCWWEGCEGNFRGTAGTAVTIRSERLHTFMRTYQRPVDITNPAGVVVPGYRALVRLNTGELIAAGKMRSDCGDLRFHDAAGAQLNYWLESGCGDADTLVWVRLDQLPAEGTRIYLTYQGSDSPRTTQSDLGTLFTWLGYDNGGVNTVWLGANRGIRGQEEDWQPATRLAWCDVNRTSQGVCPENSVAQVVENAVAGLPAIDFHTDDLAAHGLAGGDYLSENRNRFYFVLRAPADNTVFWFGGNEIWIEGRQINYILGRYHEEILLQSPAVVEDRFIMLSVYQDGADMGIELNGAQVAFRSPVSYTVDLVNNNPQMHYGDTGGLLMAEALVFNTGLDSTMKAEVEHYLNTKYRLYATDLLPVVTVGNEQVQETVPADWQVLFGGQEGTISTIVDQGTEVVVVAPVPSRGGYNRVVFRNLGTGEELVLAQGFIYPPGPVNQPPEVEIVSPADGQVFLPQDTIALQARATDADGTVQEVTFYNMGQQLGSTILAGQLIGSHIAPFGRYEITARAMDDDGDVNYSVPVTVQVAAPLERAAGNLVIDGDPAGWESATPYTIGYRSVGEVQSPADLSGQFQVLMDPDNLYLLFTVRDDRLSDPDSGGTADDDSIEFFLDGDNSKGDAYDGRNDCQYRLVIATNTLFAGQEYCGTTGARSAVVTTGDGYRAEISLPWSNLGVVPVTGSPLGLDVQINDDDDGNGRDAALSWNDVRNTNWQTAANFATFVLQGGFAPGDLNGDGQVDLQDLVPALQVSVGLEPATNLVPEAEATGNSRIDPGEAVHVLRSMAAE